MTGLGVMVNLTRNLRSLDLGGCNLGGISDDVLMMLAQSSIERLVLHATDITDRHIQCLCSSATLRFVALDGCDFVTEETEVHLTRAGIAFSRPEPMTSGSEVSDDEPEMWGPDDDPMADWGMWHPDREDGPDFA